MTRPKSDKDIFFTVQTPIGFSVTVTRVWWETIVTMKHPVMRGQEDQVRVALEKPDEVRLSKVDDKVYLFYKAQREKRWVCAVTKRSEESGFLITVYPTDAIKEGQKIWPK
jgi:hypothetical protein